MCTMEGMSAPISRRRALSVAAAAGVALPAAVASQALAAPPSLRGRGSPVRVATFNASLNREREGQLVEDLRSGTDPQIRAVASIIQINNPDILLINEFDYDASGEAVDLFRRLYLEVGHNGLTPVHYPHAYIAPVNTGVPTGLDLNGDGQAQGPDDAFGFGQFPGQYGMLLLSRFPIVTGEVRTFQKLLWKSMPGSLMPEDYYSPEAVDALRLSSKSHWDVPVRVGDRVLHVLAAHPTPPSFDGPEDRNGRRNSDEIRLWADYISAGPASNWIVDDAGRRGGLHASERFVILGDYNSDPLDGDSWPGAIDQLLRHPRVRDSQPTSEGAVQAAQRQAGSNAQHRGDPRLDTADFSEPAPGNLRVDYVLPSKNISVSAAAVFWPRQGEPGFELVGEHPFPSSDHRLVRADLVIPGS